jgi:cyclophilin family peptidyl-prolyl cis-trans isomerase
MTFYVHVYSVSKEVSTDFNLGIVFYASEDELHPELRFTGAGILAMANSGPNTNGVCASVLPQLWIDDNIC